MAITPIRPGLTDPVNLITHGNNHGFTIIKDPGADNQHEEINLNYIEAVRVLEDISEWLHSESAS